MNIIMKTFLFFICFPTMAKSWELELDKNNIQVYTKTINGSDFKAFRGTTNVNSGLMNTIAHHMNLEAMTEWLQDCSESKLIKKINGRDFYLYQRTSAPWPVSDRDYVVHMHVSQDSSDYSVLITFEANTELANTDQECVPVTNIKGYWRFTPKDKNNVFVEYETAADPAGDLPAWLANSFVVDQPYGTLKNLKKRVENNVYTLPKEMNYIKQPIFAKEQEK